MAVPNLLNASTDLVCSFIGDRKDPERLTISELLDKLGRICRFRGYPEALKMRPTDELRLGRRHVLMVKCAQSM